MANISLSTGIVTAGQIPLDAKLKFDTYESILDLGAFEVKPFSYYRGMVIFCVETEKEYIWKEVDQTIPLEQSVLPSAFTYPVGTVTEGVDYGGKSYNFYLLVPEINDGVNTPGGKDYQIRSGNVFMIGGLNYQSTVIYYSIGGEDFVVPVTRGTLSDSDGVYGRIDTFVVNTNSELVVIEGIPSENPQEPIIDFVTQLRIGIVIVPANATDVSNTTGTLIYDEGVGTPDEWEQLGSSTGINMTYAIDPYKGSNCIQVSYAPILILSALTGSFTPFSTDHSITFAVKISGSWNNTPEFIEARLINNRAGRGAINSNPVRIDYNNDSNFGLDLSNNFDWQICIIPLNLFTNFPRVNSFDKLVLSFDSTSILYLDDVKTQVPYEVPTYVPSTTKPKIIDLGVADDSDTDINHIINYSPSFQLIKGGLYFLQFVKNNNTITYVYTGNLPFIIGDESIITSSSLQLLSVVPLNTFPTITVFGNLFTLSKNPTNNDLTQKNNLEINDIIYNGYYDSQTLWLIARYIGGDKDQASSWDIISIIEELPLT